MFVVATVQWFVDGRKNFKGPRFDAHALEHGGVIGMPHPQAEARARRESGGSVGTVEEMKMKDEEE